VWQLWIKNPDDDSPIEVKAVEEMTLEDFGQLVICACEMGFVSRAGAGHA